MRIALAHDYLTRFGGAERVLKTLHTAYPDAPIFSLIARDHVVSEHFPNADVRTSFAQRAPFSHRMALPMLPFAVESFDTSGYDVVLSGTSAFMKGLVTRSSTTHISYIHTPPRYLWEDRLKYTREHIPKLFRWAAAPVMHAVRLWDQQAAHRPDRMLANSRYTKDRIRRYYDIDADVLYPPVDMEVYPMDDHLRRQHDLPEEYFLLVSRLAWWKHPETAIDAFSALKLPLVVVGSGPMRRSLERAAGETIRFLGTLPDAEVRQLMHGASALLHPSVEDFGITAVEAMAQGTPVIAYARGGALETVNHGQSGILYEDNDPLSLANAVRLAREQSWNRDGIQKSVHAYAPEQFLSGMADAIRATTAER